MKKNETPLSKKKSTTSLSLVSSIVKSTKGFWKRYFPDKQKVQPPKEEIEESDWWKWTH